MRRKATGDGRRRLVLLAAILVWVSGELGVAEAQGRSGQRGKSSSSQGQNPSATGEVPGGDGGSGGEDEMTFASSSLLEAQSELDANNDSNANGNSANGNSANANSANANGNGNSGNANNGNANNGRSENAGGVNRRLRQQRKRLTATEELEFYMTEEVRKFGPPEPSEDPGTDDVETDEDPEAPVFGQKDPKRREGSYIIAVRKGGRREETDDRARDVRRKVKDEGEGEVRREVNIADELRFVTVKLNPKKLRKIARNKHIEYIEIDREVLPEQGTSCTTQTLTSGGQWGLDRLDQSDAPLDGRFTAPGTGSSSSTPVNIYVLDSGVNHEHSEFEGRAEPDVDVCYWTGYDPNYPDQDLCGPGDGDMRGHGSLVAGLAASKTYGVSKHALVHSIKVLNNIGVGSSLNIFDGLSHVMLDSEYRQGPSIINLSVDGPQSITVDRMVTIARDKYNMTVIAAAGNSAIDACFRSPSGAFGAFTIGATDFDDSFAVFSNFGACVDMLAPGVSLQSPSNIGQELKYDTGTSFAAPLTTGAAALYLADNPTALPTDVENWLLDNAVAGKAASGGRSLAGTPDLLLHLPNNQCSTR